MMTRTAADKFSTLSQLPMSQWRRAITSNWDPKRDFSFAMRHAERLMKLQVDATVAELLLEQAQKFESRRELAEKWVARAEHRAQATLGEILA
jgi:hypothetical protein